MTPKFILSADGATVDEQLSRGRDLTVNGVRHPRDVFDKWTDAELAAIGAYRVTPATVPEGERVVSQRFTRNGDRFLEVVETEPKPVVAAEITLSRAEFFLALDGALALGASDPLIEDHVKATISASLALDDATKRKALILVGAATEFPRNDPRNPGLIDAIGALFGFASAAIDGIFVGAAAQRGGA